jgi:two-component system CheB/CheR fusion protein
LLAAFVPPAVVINSEGDIVYVVGHTGKYLEPSAGKVNLNIFAMARERLRLELGVAVRSAVQRRASVTVEGLRFRTDGAEQIVNLTVRPLSDAPEGRELWLVAFEEGKPEAAGAKAGRAPHVAMHGSARARLVERELGRTKDLLRRTIVEMGAAQEELKAANEELQSNNEELQSTNEELTTTKEELQSLNEEMTTVNSELQGKMDELSHVNDDMTNLLNGIDVAAVFAGNDLHIRRFTPQALRIINLIPGDVGRPLSHVVTNLKYEHLVEDAKGVLETLALKEVQVQTKDGRWCLMRILPYRTADNVIDGVAITFSDITPLTSLRETQVALEEAENVVAALPQALLVLDAEQRIVSANPAFCGTFRMEAEQVRGRSLYEIAQRAWDVPELKPRLEGLVAGKTELQDFRLEQDFPGVGRKGFLLIARRIPHPAERPPLVLLTMEEVGGMKGEG